MDNATASDKAGELSVQQIESGSAEVIASGSVISFEGNPITITYGAGETRLKLTFEFKTDPSRKDPYVLGSSADPLSLRVVLFNFDSPLGVGTSTPTPIGTIGDRKLYIHYRVNTLSSTPDKTLLYTIYADKKVAPSA